MFFPEGNWKSFSAPADFRNQGQLFSYKTVGKIQFLHDKSWLLPQYTTLVKNVRWAHETKFSI